MPYSSSKTALNALTVHYTRELADTPIKVNGAAPGHVATDFNNFRGTRTPEEWEAVGDSDSRSSEPWTIRRCIRRRT